MSSGVTPRPMKSSSSEAIVVSKRSQTVLKFAMGLTLPVVAAVAGFAWRLDSTVTRLDAAIGVNTKAIAQTSDDLKALREKQAKANEELRELFHGVDKRLAAIEGSLEVLTERRRRR